MSSPESDDQMLEGAKAGHPDAIRQVYERYYERLVKIARAALKHVRSVMAEPEGAVDSALASFARIAREGRCKELENLDHLLALLVKITTRKAGKLKAYLKAAKRDWEITVQPQETPSRNGHAHQPEAHELPPDVVAELADEVRHLMALLGDETLQDVATYKMHGYTHEEIAAKLNCSLATIERKHTKIRHIWQDKGVNP